MTAADRAKVARYRNLIVMANNRREALQSWNLNAAERKELEKELKRICKRIKRADKELFAQAGREVDANEERWLLNRVSDAASRAAER